MKSKKDREKEKKRKQSILEKEIMSIMSKSLKTALFGFARGHRAIMSERVHDQYRLAWDTMKVVRYAVAWHTRPMGGATVDFDTPIRYGSEPLPKCTVKVARNTHQQIPERQYRDAADAQNNAKRSENK